MQESNHSNHDSALIVNEGVEQPPITNPYIGNFYKKNKTRTLSVDEFVEGILSGNISVLSQAITLVESNRHDHRIMAQEILERCQSHGVESCPHGQTPVGSRCSRCRKKHIY